MSPKRGIEGRASKRCPPALKKPTVMLWTAPMGLQERSWWGPLRPERVPDWQQQQNRHVSHTATGSEFCQEPHHVRFERGPRALVETEAPVDSLIWDPEQRTQLWHDWTSNLQNCCEIINVCSLELLCLWQFITQKEKVNTQPQSAGPLSSLSECSPALRDGRHLYRVVLQAPERQRLSHQAYPFSPKGLLLRPSPALWFSLQPLSQNRMLILSNPRWLTFLEPDSHWALTLFPPVPDRQPFPGALFLPQQPPNWSTTSSLPS